MKPNPSLNKPFPSVLKKKLAQRIDNESLRRLSQPKPDLIDFASNDYLGFSRNNSIADFAQDKLHAYSSKLNAATGSRLLTGNYKMIEDFEDYLQVYYNAEAATVFNSGYDANLGLLSAIGERQDLILYDEFSHASIRDGIALSKAKAYKFKHNNLEDLEAKLSKFRHQFKTVYVITEHVFSMDGDQANVEAIIELCQTCEAYFILDEAHSVGVLKLRGCSHLSADILARVVTFGKAFGSHGAAVLGALDLKQVLVNFAKSFIYTTAPSPETTARNWSAHEHLAGDAKPLQTLKSRIDYFQNKTEELKLNTQFISSQSAIQSCVIPGNQYVKSTSKLLQKEGFDVRPILSPTVPLGKERLRFCLHSFTTEAEIDEVLICLRKLLT